MIYLEDYDLPVIALNVNMFMAALLFIFTDTLYQIIDVIDAGMSGVFSFGAFLLSVLAVLLLMMMLTFTALVDIWWVQKKTADNRRWL